MPPWLCVFLPAAILVALATSRFQFAEPASPRSHPGLVPRQDSVVDWLRLSMVLDAVLPIAFYTFAAAYSCPHAFEEVSLWLDGTARVTQEHASKVFQTNGVVIGRAFDAVGSDDDVVKLVLRPPAAAAHALACEAAREPAAPQLSRAGDNPSALSSPVAR